MDDFDDFGIPDEVLNELFDLQRGGGAPPAPTAPLPPPPAPAAQLPPPPAEWQPQQWQQAAEWQQPPPPAQHANMFDDFDPAGPLPPQAPAHSAATDRHVVGRPAGEGHEDEFRVVLS